MDTIRRRRRVSSVTSDADGDTNDDQVSTVSVNTFEEKTISVPITTVPDDNVSLASSLSTTNKSTFSISNPMMKCTPVVSTTNANANSSSDNVSKNKAHEREEGRDNLVNDLKAELNLTNHNQGESTGLTESGSIMGSLFKNIAGYRSSANDPELSPSYTKKESINETLDEGIKFATENGTEMLSYRRSRGKSGSNYHARTPSGAHKRNISTASTISSELASPDSSSHNFINSLSPVVPPAPKEVDYSLYVDEKYLDTQYRYATIKRNNEFHQVFPDIPKDDRLLDDFSCALSREILLQGRLYISEHYLCFNSSLLGWVTSMVISLDEISKFERRSTVGLFPNGIIVETKDSKHIFASFISRDQTLNFIETIWSKSISLSKQNNESPRDVENFETRSSFDRINGNVKPLSESDLYTIDSDDSSQHEYQYNDESDDDEGGDEAITVHGWDNEVLTQTSKGPLRHAPSTYSIDYVATNQQIVLDKTYDVPLGVLYGIFFGDNNDFHQKMMLLNDGFEFTDYGLFTGEGSERLFEYEKKLNYPVGPSSTRVHCTEKLEHLDFDDYVEVLNISKTPNVPSGTAFDCRTKYLMKWDENNKTRLIISFKLEWTGSSWIKKVIESSALSGQKKAAEDADRELLEIIPNKIRELSLNGKTEGENSFKESTGKKLLRKQKILKQEKLPKSDDEKVNKTSDDISSSQKNNSISISFFETLSQKANFVGVGLLIIVTAYLSFEIHKIRKENKILLEALQQQSIMLRQIKDQLAYR